MDNVLEDLVTPWVEAINKKYSRNVKADDIRSWDITKYFNGLSRNQVYSPLHKKELWDSLKPLEGAIEYTNRLKEDGHSIYLLTSAHPDTIAYKFKFLSKYFPFIPFSDVIISSHKQMITGDILIDDAPHNLEGGTYKGMLMDAPHNKSYDEKKSGFIRVHNWEEIYNEIKSIEEVS